MLDTDSRISRSDLCCNFNGRGGQFGQQFFFDRLALFVDLFERRVDIVHVRVVGHRLVAHEMQDDFGHAAWRAVARALKDHVEHGRAAQVLDALLAQDPRDGVRHVRLAAAVRADDSRDAFAGEDEVGVIREGFEACDL